MRALRDFNTPKIISDDVPIFMGLIGDLFPALDVPRKRDMDFEACVKQSVLVNKKLSYTFRGKMHVHVQCITQSVLLLLYINMLRTLASKLKMVLYSKLFNWRSSFMSDILCLL